RGPDHRCRGTELHAAPGRDPDGPPARGGVPGCRHGRITPAGHGHVDRALVQVTHATGRGRRRSRPAGLAALAVLVATTSAVASSGVPVGFGDARFGMAPDAVKRIFPALTQIPGIPSAGIASARLDGQTFATLSPCELTFNFLDDKLYEIQFDCGRDPK